MRDPASLLARSHGATFTPNAVARMLMRNSAMNAKTTVSLTACADCRGAAADVQPLVAGDQTGGEPEQQRLDERDDHLRQARQQSHSGDECAGGDVLHVHDEEVAAR